MTDKTQPAFSLICLGVGKGSSYVMRGVTSTAFALLRHQRPIVLVDCGAGVVLSCLKHIGTIPRVIVVTHNHADHTGDLSVVLHTAKTAYSVCGHPDVLRLVQQHRLHDSDEALAAVIALHDWQPAIPDAAAPHGRLTLPLDVPDAPLTLALVPVRHRYLCYGFVVWWMGAPLFAYSADSGFDAALYDQLSIAPTVLLDGRDTGCRDHASFDEIDAYALRTPSVRYWVAHHENASHTFAAPNASLLHEGQRLILEAV